VITVKEVGFNEVLPVWSEYLWPNSRNLRPMSSLCFLGEYDNEIYNKYTARFSVAELDGRIIGVNSCHQTSKLHYRSRGIYVFDEYRRQGVAQLLFNFVKQSAIEAGCGLIWSLPRLDALSAYKTFGFTEVGEVVNQGVEYGPNIFVALRI